MNGQSTLRKQCRDIVDIIIIRYQIVNIIIIIIIILCNGEIFIFRSPTLPSNAPGPGGEDHP